MFDIQNEYYRRRAVQERDMAKQSKGEGARIVHERLAAAYILRAHGDELAAATAE